jgi:phospholipid N-methyltransferase
MARGDAALFFRAFLRNPTKIGAIAPSSPSLARAMVRDLTLTAGETVVEFGPGTGPFTAEIAGLLPDPRCYLGIERDPDFVATLRVRFPHLTFVEGSAEHAPRYLAGAGRGRVRRVICGLPFASLPPSVQDAIVATLDRLIEPGSEFRTFQYVHAFALPTAIRFRRRMRALFGPFTREATVVRNLPPAHVLSWKR